MEELLEGSETHLDMYSGNICLTENMLTTYMYNNFLVYMNCQWVQVPSCA